MAVSGLVIVIPGSDTLLVTKNAVLHGRAVGLGTALGVCGGLLVWTTATALGVAAIVRGSAAAFTVLKLVGGAYLVWLGVQVLRGRRARSAFEPAAARDRSRSVGRWLGFRQGLLGNLANPKIAVFFTSLLPQFVSSREPSHLLPYLLLGGVFVVMTLVWLGGCSVAAAKLSHALIRSRVRTALDRMTGAVLVGLGVRLALERR
jgi:RhtB (resistance to homoserine/threonine) family protein